MTIELDDIFGNAPLVVRGSSSPIWIDAPQGSDLWFSSRIGCLTASLAAAAFSFGAKGKESAERAKLKIEILAEWMTQQAIPMFVNGAMKWGTEQEPFARVAYEAVTGNEVVECGFALHGSIDLLGASPDGTIGDDGLIEIKCPQSNTFVQWLIDDEIPAQHIEQMNVQLAVTGRKWCDFVAYDPRMPEEYQLIIKRYEPGPEIIAATEEKARQFLAEVMELWKTIRDGKSF